MDKTNISECGCQHTFWSVSGYRSSSSSFCSEHKDKPKEVKDRVINLARKELGLARVSKKFALINPTSNGE